MNRYRSIMFASLGALACVVIVAAFSAHQEPRWEGQRLSCWLYVGYGVGMTHGETDKDNADAAVKHIGVKALPYLIHELGAKFSHTRWKLWQLHQQQPLIYFDYTYPDERRARAIGGFEALGKIAEPALPQIRRYLSDPELQSDAQRAIDAILAYGKPYKSEEQSTDTASP